jgi:hypothetical protein
MTITLCPHCQMRVLPKPDGTCPSCNGLIAQTDAPPPSKVSSAVAKQAAKAAERKKAAPKSAAARSRPPAPPSTREIPALYQDYQQTAVEVRRGVMRKFISYLVGGILLCAVSAGVSFFTWDEVFVDNLARRPSTASWVLIWLGVVLLLGSIVLGAVKSEQWGNARVRDIAQDRAGYPEFYKAYKKRYWPKEGMISGPAYEKFLTLVGKKKS